MTQNASTTMSIFSTASYSDQLPTLGRSTIDYVPDNADVLRYRLGKTYNSSARLTEDQNPDSPSISYSLEFVDQIEQRGPGSYKEKATIRPYVQSPGSMFSTDYDSSDTYNQQPTINNWVNSFTNIQGVPNILDIRQPLYGQENTYKDLSFDFKFAVDERYKNLINNADMYGASVDVNYNYYNQTYENVMGYQSYVSSSAELNAFQVNERLTPSYYALSTILGENLTNQDLEAMIIATLNGNIDQETFKTSANNKVNLANLDYFTEYARTLFSIRNDSDNNSFLNIIADNQRNIILQESKLSSLFEDSKNILSDIPLYNKITFDMGSFSKNSDVAEFESLTTFLSQYKLWSTFITTYIDTFKKDQLQVIDRKPEPFNVYSRYGVPFAPDNFYEGVSTPENLKAYEIDFKSSPTLDFQQQGQTLNFIQFFNKFYEDLLVFLPGKHEEESLWLEANFADIWSTGVTQQINPILQNIIENNARTWEMIVDNNKAPSYSIFYKVEKWSVDANNNPQELIQNFFVPNNGQTPEATIYDSQVKYGKSYIYRIYAYNLVIGTSYHYELDDITQPDSQVPNDIKSEVCIISSPDLRLVQTPYYQKLITVVDKPPVSPDVSIYPYLGSQNKITFTLKGNVGEALQKPVVINPEDQVIFNNIRKSLNLGPDEMITFKSDDPTVKFDVFKLDNRPTSYEYFKFAEYKQIETTGFENPYKKAASAALDDFIEPNKKYYYTFRAVDVHGNISNPSPIYELEISYDGASAFLITKIIDLKPEKIPPQEATKRFKKYIRIKPSYDQTLLNEEQTGIIKNDGTFDSDWFPKLQNDPQNPDKKIILGKDENSLWGKNFKIRITSKKSGKKIDLNINFKTNKVIIDEKDVNNIS
jgi:hypothetical protein